MAVEDWVITEIREDYDGAEDRWLVIYNVPKAYASDGVFSFSFPKSSFSYRAAEFGYDVDDPDDREVLFQHVMHEGYLGATGQLTATGDLNPARGTSEAAKGRAAQRLAEVRRTLRMKQAERPVVKRAGRAALADDIPADVLDVIRADMRIDRELISKHASMVNRVRADHARDEARRASVNS